MKITILSNNERDYSVYADLIKFLNENNIESHSIESTQRGVGEVLISIFTNSALSVFLESIKTKFSKTEIEIDFKDDKKEFHVKTNAGNINLNEIVGYLTDSKITITDEKKEVTRFENPIEIDFKIGK